MQPTSDFTSKQIEKLEAKLSKQSELAYLLDKERNYELSYSIHSEIIEIINKIRYLKEHIKPQFTFDFQAPSYLDSIDNDKT